MARCFLIGHRELDRTILPQLRASLVRQVEEYGVSEFYVGHYGGFDRVAAVALREVKRDYPQVRLFLLIPYHPAERPVETPEGFDGTYYPNGMERVPRQMAIVRANRCMVDGGGLRHWCCSASGQQRRKDSRLCSTPRKTHGQYP